MPPKKPLGQLLTEERIVDEHQLQSALGHQKQWGGKLGAILVQKGFCKEADVVRVLAKHLGIPIVNLREARIDPRAVKLIARPVAEKFRCLAYEITGAGRMEVVTIAMSEPTDLSVIDQLSFATGKRVKPMLCGDSEIAAAIALQYGAQQGAAPGAPSALGAAGRPGVAGPPATGRIAPVQPPSTSGQSRRPAP
ncbi:MAG: hypothetical protein JST92_16820, partial [Deltaproteobacteria bacterium]|nr:hypothetical protein [Deltaproteobacteria bacterium]